MVATVQYDCTRNDLHLSPSKHDLNQTECCVSGLCDSGNPAVCSHDLPALHGHDFGWRRDIDGDGSRSARDTSSAFAVDVHFENVAGSSSFGTRRCGLLSSRCPDAFISSGPAEVEQHLLCVECRFGKSYLGQ